MRETQFRAWDKNTKEWIEPALFAVTGTGHILLYRDGQWKITYEDIEIVRFTGLHDKNDKPIFEGDIVEYEFAPCGIQRGEFIFDEGSFYLKGTGKWRPYDCEVIGNIYETPELLHNS